MTGNGSLAPIAVVVRRGERVESDHRVAYAVAAADGRLLEAAGDVARPGWAALPAVRAGELHEISSSLILQPGPAVLTDGLARLAQIVDRWQGARPPG